MEKTLRYSYQIPIFEKNYKMKYLSLFACLFLLISCEKNQKYLIAKNQLGDLNHTTKVHQIKSLMASDSVELINAMTPYGKRIESTIRRVEVYDTTGQQILIINPTAGLDSISNIKSIRILTDKYKTKDGIALGSSFAEVKKHYEITDIQSSPRSIIMPLKELNAFISFDRKVLSGDIQFDRDAEIKPIMIPDDAKINRFWLNFEVQNNGEQ